ncbi:MAG: hypothetical protein ACRETD_11035, partial [Steroidobacteraceae bacterium]
MDRRGCEISRQEGICSFHATVPNQYKWPTSDCTWRAENRLAPFWRVILWRLPVAGAVKFPSHRLSFAPMLDQIVIVGAGQAAVQAADTLRRKGLTGKLTVVGDEPWLPY